MVRRLVFLLLAGCAGSAPAQVVWRQEEPTSVTRTGVFAQPDLTESSGVVASRRTPGLLWTHNDGGNDAVLYATDTTGRALGAIPFDTIPNLDWEALSHGPCPAGDCLYLADTGNNRRNRKSVFVYRFPEPADPRSVARPSLGPVERLELRYPDGPQDVEALIVTPEGSLLLLAKSVATEARLYRVPAGAWQADGIAEAQALGTVPIEAMSAIGRWVTDAALAPDGRRVVVRTYRDLFFFTLQNDRELVPGDPPRLCDITGIEPQGEGVAWLDDTTLVLTSEQAMSSEAEIHVVRCPAIAAGARG